MKKLKTAGTVLATAIAAIVLIFVLMAHGDDLVSGVAIADRQMDDIKTLDTINSSKGTKLNAFDGTLYTTSCVEFGKFAVTNIAPVPQGKALYANVLFTSSPQGMKYKAVWLKDGAVVKEEAMTITVANSVEAVSFMLEGSLVQTGEYVFAVLYGEKQIYSQTLAVE